jgi:TonB family protein
MRSLLVLAALSLVAPGCTRSAPRAAKRSLASRGEAVAPLVIASCPKLPTALEGGYGSIPKEDIRRVVRQHLGEVRQCYEVALGRREAFAGRIEMRFTIANSGAVCAAQVAESTIPDVELGNCIVQALAGWHFPPITGMGHVLVTYPFIFKANPQRL